MNLRVCRVLVIGLFWVSLPASGQEIPEHYHPVRPMAMGGAFTAIANDENAVWTNPAGIARIRKARSRSVVNLVKFPNAIAGANLSGKDFYSSLQQANEEDSASTLSANADDLTEKPFWAMAGAFPMMMLDFGSMPAVMGGFSHTTMKAVVDEENVNQAYTEIISDVGGVLSLAYTNRTNRLNIGIQVRSVARLAYEDTIATTSLVDSEVMQTLIQDGANKSAGLGVDAGFMWTFGDFWFPTIGIAVLNVPLGCKDDYLNPFSKKRETVCGTVFSGDFANPDAISTVDPTDIRFGVSITPRLTRKIALRIALDVHHFHYAAGVNNFGYSEIPVLKTIHGGVELFVGNPLLPAPVSASVGMSQGYYTMGGSMRLGFLSLDFATFGKDISTTDSPQEDRRIMGGFSIDF